MVKGIARGHRWHRMLCDGVYNSIEDLAATEKINASYVQGSRGWHSWHLQSSRQYWKASNLLT